MKSLFLGTVVAMTLLAVTTAAQPQGPVRITPAPDGDSVKAVSGDLSCIFAMPDGSDFMQIKCFLGRRLVLDQSPRDPKVGSPITGSFTTPDGNFISWTLSQPTLHNFTWSIDDDGTPGSGSFN